MRQPNSIQKNPSFPLSPSRKPQSKVGIIFILCMVSADGAVLKDVVAKNFEFYFEFCRYEHFNPLMLSAAGLFKYL